MAARAQLRRARADDPVRGAVGGGGDGDRDAAVDRDALVEAEQLHRDLPLIVVHRHDTVEVAAGGPGEESVTGEGACDVDPAGAGEGDRRGDVVDLLAPELPALTRVRVERAHRQSRGGRPRLPDDAVEELDRLEHPAGADARSDLGDRNVRGHPGGDERIDEIELGGESPVAEPLGEPPQLVLLRHARLRHRPLVEGEEEDSVGVLGRAQVERGAEVDQRPPARVGTHLADGDGGTVVGGADELDLLEVGQVDAGGVGERAQLVRRRGDGEVGAGPIALVDEDAGEEFGSDPGEVAGDEDDARLGRRGGHFPIASRSSLSFSARYFEKSSP